MIGLGTLWLAILVSTVLVWIASALIWMVAPHHKTERRAIPDEDAARGALAGLLPGQYDVPHCVSMETMRSDEGRARFEQGPVAFVTVAPNGLPAMGRNIGLSVVFYLVTSTVVAYVASRALAPGAEALAVFRLASTVAWVAYGFAVIPDAIWFARPWSNVLKLLGDALVYAILTGGVLAVLWPGT